MERPLDSIVFATSHPLLIAEMRELLECAGLDAELLVVVPEVLRHSLNPRELSMVILECEDEPAWEELKEIVHAAPEARVVLWRRDVQPHLIYCALEAGIRGILSRDLPVPEAALFLEQVSRGESQFRYATAMPNPGREKKLAKERRTKKNESARRPEHTAPAAAPMRRRSAGAG